jgi:hypothetical protein
MEQERNQNPTGKKPIDNEIMNEPIFLPGEMPLSDFGEVLNDENKSFDDYGKA